MENAVHCQIKRINPAAHLPVYKKKGDAGFDLYCIEDTLVLPGETALLPTGLAFAIPCGFEMQIRMRSGASLQTPLILANAPGTIDSGFRGEVKIIVRNTAAFSYLVKKGQRIAQGVICPVFEAIFDEVQHLPDSERGESGFGSTGV